MNKEVMGKVFCPHILKCIHKHHKHIRKHQLYFSYSIMKKMFMKGG